MGAPKGSKNALGNKGPVGNHNVGAKKIYTKEFIENEAKEFLKWAQNFPKGKPLFYKRFALDRGYSPQRIHEWSKENKEFAEVFEIIKSYQESNWLENAMTNDYNWGMAKFCLKHHHKYKEESDSNEKQIVLKLSSLE